MRDIQPALYGKRPATIVRQEPPTEILSAGQYDYHQLVRRVADLERAGQIARARRRPRWNEGTQEWRIPVHRLKEPPSPWRRRALLAAPIVAVALLVLYALHTLGAWIGIMALCAILGLFSAGIYKTFFTKSVNVTVTTTTTVNVRR